MNNDPTLSEQITMINYEKLRSKVNDILPERVEGFKKGDIVKIKAY